MKSGLDLGHRTSQTNKPINLPEPAEETELSGSRVGAAGQDIQPWNSSWDTAACQEGSCLLAPRVARRGFCWGWIPWRRKRSLGRAGWPRASGPGFHPGLMRTLCWKEDAVGLSHLQALEGIKSLHLPPPCLCVLPLEVTAKSRTRSLRVLKQLWDRVPFPYSFLVQPFSLEYFVSYVYPL